MPVDVNSARGISGGKADDIYTQALREDPQFMQIWQQVASGQLSERAAEGPLQARAKALGVPLGNDFKLEHKNGLPNVDHQNFFEKHKKAIIITGLAAAGGIGALGAAGMLGGGAAAAGAGGASTAALPVASGLPAGLVGAAGPGFIAGGAAPAAATAAGASTLDKVLGAVKKASPLLKAGGAAISGATEAAASNRGAADDFALRQKQLELESNQLGLSGYRANVDAQSALENELMKRADVEAGQRKIGASNLYKASVVGNPTASPYNPRPQTLSPAMQQVYAALEGQAQKELTQAPEYSTRNLARPTYTPYTQPGFTPPVQKKPGTLEQVGNWLGPILGFGSMIGKRA